MSNWNQHLLQVNESYFEHGGKALSFSGRMLAASVMCAIHAVFPFLFTNSASSIVEKLYNDIKVHRTGSKSMNKSDDSVVSN